MSEEFNKAMDTQVEAMLKDPKINDRIGRILALTDYYKPAMSITLSAISIPVNIREMVEEMSDESKMIALRHEALHQMLMDRRVGEYKLFSRDDDSLLDLVPIPAKQKPKPTWQDRRQQSADAKAALIARMRK